MARRKHRSHPREFAAVREDLVYGEIEDRRGRKHPFAAMHEQAVYGVYENPRNPSTEAWLAIGGAVLAGVGIILLVGRSSSAQTLPPPSGSQPGSQPSVSSSSVTVSSNGNLIYTPDRIALLQSSEQARQIYAFQYLMWSYGETQSPPDGVYGPNTQAMMNQVYSVMEMATEALGPAPSSFPTDQASVTDLYTTTAQAIVANGLNNSQKQLVTNIPDTVQAQIMSEIPSQVSTILAGT
jgi:hypothetical protein